MANNNQPKLNIDEMQASNITSDYLALKEVYYKLKNQKRESKVTPINIKNAMIDIDHGYGVELITNQFGSKMIRNYNLDDILSHCLPILNEGNQAIVKELTWTRFSKEPKPEQTRKNKLSISDVNWSTKVSNAIRLLLFAALGDYETKLSTLVQTSWSNVGVTLPLEQSKDENSLHDLINYIKRTKFQIPRIDESEMNFYQSYVSKQLIWEDIYYLTYTDVITLLDYVCNNVNIELIAFAIDEFNNSLDDLFEEQNEDENSQKLHDKAAESADDLLENVLDIYAILRGEG